MGLDPTHLDAHMHALYATPQLFAVLRKVARDYRLPIRMARNEQVFRDLLPYVDAAVPFPDAIFSPLGDVPPSAWKRSEEHTSELQSRFDLVCRLLLEKKKKK